MPSTNKSTIMLRDSDMEIELSGDEDGCNFTLSFTSQDGSRFVAVMSDQDMDSLGELIDGRNDSSDDEDTR